MGSLSAIDMAEHAPSLRVALEWHLKANHYPPVPLSMVEPCEAAIDAANEGDNDRAIDLPSGVTYRGETSAPAHAIVSGHHLQAFLSEGGGHERRPE